MAKLWQKTYTIDSLLEEFTVGIDYQLDQALVRADCLGSVAQARGLAKLGILSQDELASLTEGLRGIARQASAGSFAIARSDEDCHTAIENQLVAQLGEAGKKIHTGRSRNDQVVTACRLHGKSSLLEIRAALLALIQRVRQFAETHRGLPMPGRTHMQIAMPSSVGLWAGSLAEQLADDYRLVMAAWELCDQSPLGSSAGYGVPLALDRNYTASLMGFARPANNVLYASNSRGKVESVILDALDQVCLTLSKFAQDLILFSLPEFGYFKLPDRLCTGSSIMPQKKNPDGLELLRSRSALMSGWASQCKMILRSLPTGYNRDFQDTKEPYLRGLSVALACVRIMDLSFEGLEPVPARLEAAFGPEIWATDDALKLVAGGMSFRDAYRQVGTNLGQVKAAPAAESISSRTYPGTAGNLNLTALDPWLQAMAEAQEGDRQRFGSAIKELLGEEGSRL